MALNPSPTPDFSQLAAQIGDLELVASSIVKVCSASLDRGITGILLSDNTHEHLVLAAYGDIPFDLKGYAMTSLSDNPFLTEIIGNRRTKVTNTAVNFYAVRTGLDIGFFSNAALIAPIVAQQTELGMLIYVNDKGVYTGEEIETLEGIANLAASTVENAGQSEKRLRVSKQFQQLHANSRHPIAVFDTDLTIQESNQALGNLLGVESGFLVKRNLSDYFARSSEENAFQEYIAQVKKTGAAFIETRLQRSDGEIIHVDIYASLLNINGKPMVKAFIRDTTAQKQAYFDLQRVNRQVISILESTTDAYISVDTNWRVGYFNHQAEIVFSIERKHIIGEDLWEELPEMVSSFFRPMKDAVTSKRPQQVVGYYPPQDRWMEAHIFPYEGGAAVYLKDITKRKMTEEALRSRESHLEAILDNIVEGIVTIDKTPRLSCLLTGLQNTCLKNPRMTSRV